MSPPDAPHALCVPPDRLPSDEALALAQEGTSRVSVPVTPRAPRLPRAERGGPRPEPAPAYCGAHCGLGLPCLPECAAADRPADH